MSFLRDLPIRRKLTSITIVAAGAALLLACASFVAYELMTFRTELVRNLSAQAEIVARQSAASVVFQDPESANGILGALGAEPRVVSAAIYAPEGALFASYLRDNRSDVASIPKPPAGRSQGEAFEQRHVVLFRPIEFDDGVIGTVMIESDLSEMTRRLQRYAFIALCVLGASFVVAHWTASRLQRVITQPIQELAAAAEAVSIGRNYSVRVVAQANDELGQLVGTFNEMLDQIQSRDAALQASEQQYRLLFDSNPHPMWVFDPATLGYLAVNDAAVRLYGWSREEFLEMTVEDIRAHDDGLPAHALRPEPRDATGHPDGIWKHRTKEGTTLDVEVSSSEIVFRGRQARFILATDVSEKRMLEVQLRQSQKMEAVGRLAGGIAHDFNNLLGVITGYSELMGRSLGPEDRDHKRLEQIKKAAERAAGLTRQLLAFSRKEVIQPRVLDLNEVVGDIEKMLQRLIGEDVRLVTRASPGLGRVKADRGQIDQVIVNLVVNARDAMPKGGDLLIETSNQTLDEAYARTHPDVVPGRYVMLAVSDTGQGMEAATLSRIFEPFFTTKEQGKGTGLGLATVFGIAKQSGGHVNVYSEVGKGATFKLYLPHVEGDADGAERAPASMPSDHGTETILLVEDAEALRAMIREILEGSGFSVLEFADPQEAVFRAEAHRGPLDLILTDVVMPRMSGPELVRAVQAVRPQVKALFMSGYTNEAIGRQGVLEPGTHFIQKPFSAAALLGSVRATIDDAPHGLRAPTPPHPSGNVSPPPVETVRPAMMSTDHRLWSAHPGTPGHGEAQSVLIIDDDSQMRSVLAAHVRDLGFACAEASDGQTGIAAARQAPPSVVLLDVHMPQMNGRQVLALLKEDPQLRAIPVIVISGSDELDQAAASVDGGAEDYLSKPLNATLLRARLRSILERSRLREQELADRRRMSRYGLELEERVKEQTRSLTEAHERLEALDEAKDGVLSLIARELGASVPGAPGMARDGLSLRAHPLSRIWSAASERAATAAASRDVRIGPPPADLGSVLCDEALLLQALASILECAVNLAAPGETVRITCAHVDGHLRLRIRTAARKLSADAIPRFFEVPSRADAIAPSGHETLGPAGAAQVLRILGGSVAVENAADAVTFDVTLAAVSPPVAAAERADV